MFIVCFEFPIFLANPGQSHSIPYLTGQVFSCGGRANFCPLDLRPPPTGVRRQAACCVSSMHRSVSALGIFWARSFHHRPYPSLSIRRDRGQERAIQQ